MSSIKKIYIIGPVGSGKTTFSKKLSKKYGIQRYELDKISWDDENGHIKRSDEEALKMFDDILKNDSWIIEDIGREQFQKGREFADVIYYIKLSKIKALARVFKRWIRQRLGKEEYNYPPVFKELIYYISIVNSYYKKEDEKLKSLKKYDDKLVFVDDKAITKILEREIN